MPTYQNGQLRIYDGTIALGKVLESAHLPGDDHDERLAEAFNAEAVDIPLSAHPDPAAAGGRGSSMGASGLARMNRSGWSHDFPDQVTSAETSTTNGSTRVRSIGVERALHLRNVLGLIRAGYGCSPVGQ